MIMKTQNGFCEQEKDQSLDTSPFRELASFVPVTPQPDKKKLEWLRSQIIGGGDSDRVVFNTPFGKRQLIYADHTASGRCLHFIEDYINTHILPIYGNSHSSDSYVGCRMTKMANEASKYTKKRLGGGEGDAIIFCGSGSTAAIKRLQEVMGISIPSNLRERVLRCLTREERWVVFIGPYEHHSNILSWRNSLAEVIEIGLLENGLMDMEALRLHLESYKSENRPMLGSFSACSNVTGIYADTRGIARMLHGYGAFSCFDFAASGPYVKIDMKSGEMDGYDAIFLSPHKFLGGPGSPGILLMNKALYQLGSSAPSTCGGGIVDYVNGINEEDTLYTKDVEKREEAGTPAIIQKIRAALAFWTKEYIGHEMIEKMEQSFINQALQRLLPNPNVKILGNTSTKRQAILSFLIHTTTSPENVNARGRYLHGSFVSKLLSDLYGIQARGGCACAGPYGHTLLEVSKPHSTALRSMIQMGYNGVKPGWTRVSFPYYMSVAEFEFVLSAIECLAVYGQRFLPLYDYNWKTGAWSFRKKSDIECASLSDMVKELKLQEEGLMHKCRLEATNCLAALLPKFPTQSPIPQDIDPGVLSFLV